MASVSGEKEGLVAAWLSLTRGVKKGGGGREGGRIRKRSVV